MKKLLFLSIVCLISLSISMLPVSAHDMVTYAEWGTPVIDGVKDAIWDKANMIEIKAIVPGLGKGLDVPENLQISAKAWTLWDGDYLYIWLEVADNLIEAVDRDDIWNQDVIGFMIDYTYNRTPELSYRDIPENERYAGYFNVAPIAADTTRNYPEMATIYGLEKYSSLTKTHLKIVDGGYIIEVAMPLIYKSYSPGDKIGLEIVLNNAIGNGNREGQVCWHEDGTEAWRYGADMGTLIFNAQVIEEIVEEVGETPATVAPTAPGVISPQTGDCSMFILLTALAVSSLVIKVSKKKI